MTKGTTLVVLDTDPAMTALLTSGDKAVIPASVAGSAALQLVPGDAPTSPEDGDIWTTSAGIYVRIDGATVGPLLSTAGTAWTSYTPTATATSGTFTTTTATGKYAQVGKTVHFYATLLITDKGTASGNIELTLPVNAASRAVIPGAEQVTTGYSVRGLINQTTSATKMFVMKYDNTSMIQDGYSFVLSGTYEAA